MTPDKSCQDELPKVITHHYEHAQRLATKAANLCHLHGGKESEAVLRRAKNQLEVAILEVVVAGFRNHQLSQCVDEVSVQLLQRADRIREHLSSKDVRAACAGRPFVSESQRPNPSVLSPKFLE
jgi:hypothetical protein